MNFIKNSIAIAVMMAVAGGAAVAQEKEKPKAQKPVPVAAVKADVAPKVDGSADDAVWKSAPVVKLEAVKGVNFKDNKGNTIIAGGTTYTQTEPVLEGMNYLVEGVLGATS